MELLDFINPSGMFLHGNRCRDYSTKDILPSSGRLIPEFDGRRSIRQMFTQKPSLTTSQSAETRSDNSGIDVARLAPEQPFHIKSQGFENIDIVRADVESSSPQTKKHAVGDEPNKLAKRLKSSTVSSADLTESKGQQSLKGFFKPKPTTISDSNASAQASGRCDPKENVSMPASVSSAERSSKRKHPDMTPHMNVSKISPLGQSAADDLERVDSQSSKTVGFSNVDTTTVHDPVESKDSWSKLFTKPPPPRCEGHNEPCISLLTKKSGMNCGRSFWMCPRPLGPTGQKERNTQWRCQTFIWCSDWNCNSTRDPTSGISPPGKS